MGILPAHRISTISAQTAGPQSAPQTSPPTAPAPRSRNPDTPLRRSPDTPPQNIPTAESTSPRNPRTAYSPSPQPAPANSPHKRIAGPHSSQSPPPASDLPAACRRDRTSCNPYGTPSHATEYPAKHSTTNSVSRRNSSSESLNPGISSVTISSQIPMSCNRRIVSRIGPIRPPSS